MTFTKKRPVYGIVRGNKSVGSVYFTSREQAQKEVRKWNKQFREFNKHPLIKKTIKLVKVKKFTSLIALKKSRK